MLSLSRVVIGGVTRVPAAVSQGGVCAITRFNSTAQVPALLYFVLNFRYGWLDLKFLFVTFS